MDSDVVLKIEGYKRIQRKMEISNIQCEISFKDNLLATITDVLTDDYIVLINFQISLSNDFFETFTLDDLLSNPLIFKVAERKGQICDDVEIRVPIQNGDFKTLQIEDVDNGIDFEMHGIATCDLYQIIQGETRLSYSLPIYPENAEFDQFTCLPRLLIEFVVNKVPKNFPDYQNMIYLTVESVYNIQNSWKKESNSYSVGTFLPICDKVSFNESHCSSSYRVIRNVKKLVLSKISFVKFENGIYKRTPKSYQDTLKKWPDTLSNLYMDQWNESETVNRCGCDEPERIQFNFFRRCYLTDITLKDFYDYVCRYQYWPFEISCDKPDEEHESDHFITFLNLTNLLYPGEKKIRFESAIYKFPKIDLDSDAKIKSILRDFTLGMETKNIFESLNELEKQINETGDKTVFVGIFELDKSLNPKIDKNYLTHIFNSVVTMPEVFESNENCLKLVEKNYQLCLSKISRKLVGHYYEFDVLKRSQTVNYEDFLGFLKSSNLYDDLLMELKMFLVPLLPLRYGLDLNNMDLSILGSITNISEDLMREAYQTSKECFDIESDLSVKKENYIYFAIEAQELESFNEAEYYYNEILNQTSADYWISYILFNIRFKTFGDAERAIKHLLQIDKNNKIGLLLLALISMLNDNINAPELYQFLLEIYPDFSEGFYSYYLLSQKLDLNVEKQYCFERARKLSPIDFDISSDMIMHVNEEMLKDFNLRLVAHNILFENWGDNENCKYLKAVVDYYLGSYDESLRTLTEYRKYYEHNIYVDILMGHCNFQLDLYRKATKIYEMVTYYYNNRYQSDMVHRLVYIRLAICYQNDLNCDDDNNLAANCLLNICTISTSLFVWKSVGKIFYKGKNFINAEKSFNEANLLNYKDAETWAYLALINVEKKDRFAAKVCWAQAKLYGLKNVFENTTKIELFLNGFNENNCLFK